VVRKKKVKERGRNLGKTKGVQEKARKGVRNGRDPRQVHGGDATWRQEIDAARWVFQKVSVSPLPQFGKESVGTGQEKKKNRQHLDCFRPATRNVGRKNGKNGQ